MTRSILVRVAALGVSATAIVGLASVARSAVEGADPYAPSSGDAATTEGGAAEGGSPDAVPATDPDAGAGAGDANADGTPDVMSDVMSKGDDVMSDATAAGGASTDGGPEAMTETDAVVTHLGPSEPLAKSKPIKAGDSIHAYASSEASLYYDNDNTLVFSPTIAGTVIDPVKGWSVKGRYLVDVVSTASVDIVSTASKRWHEVRHAGSVDLAYKPGVFGVGATGSVSSEPDYLSWVGGLSSTYEFDDKNRSVLLGFVHGQDTIGRHFTPFSVFSHKLVRNALNGAFTVVVDRATVLVVVGDAIYERGDQSKPYRYVPMFAPGTGDSIPAGTSVDSVNAQRLNEKPLEQLPLARDRYAMTLRLLHRFTSATVRVSERLYADTWGVKATTTDARYIVDAATRWELWPHLRFHTQTPAVFWKRAYEVSFDQGGAWSFPALRTGDRELSPVTAVTLGGGLRWAIASDPSPDDWAITFAADGTWTHFFDTLFIKDRISVLTTIGVEAALR